MLFQKLSQAPSLMQDFLYLASGIAQEQNVRIYLVGGIVRDLILERESEDYDIVVEGDGIAYAERIARRLKLSLLAHRHFGTASMQYSKYKIDIASCRREQYSRPGALPKVYPASLRDDLFRRDFTINTLAVSLNRSDYGCLIDSCRGMTDIKNRCIRVLHNNSFIDDPTRMLRAVRFEQRFSFRIEPKTLQCLKTAVKLNALACVNKQRLWDELRLILEESRPLRYVVRMHELIGFSFMYPSLKFGKKNRVLLSSIQRTLMLYRDRYPERRMPDAWLVYLMGLLHGLSRRDVSSFCRSFGLRKGDEEKLISVLLMESRIARLGGKNIKRSKVLDVLRQCSLEALIFFYAYCVDNAIRRAVFLFLDSLSLITLRVSGRDLQARNLIPCCLYGKTLHKLLMVKADKGFSTKVDELKAAEEIFNRFRQKKRKGS